MEQEKPPTKVNSIHSWWGKETCRKTILSQMISDRRAHLMEQCDEGIITLEIMYLLYYSLQFNHFGAFWGINAADFGISQKSLSYYSHVKSL
jgi:hypothetical protein